MARKALDKNIEAPVELAPEVTHAISQVQQTSAAIIEAAQGEHEKAAAIINQRIGRRQMTSMIQKLVTVTDLVDLQNLKDSKGYKGYTHIDHDLKPVTITTWDDYCRAVEGRSRESIDLDLNNLNSLGPELFESMRTVGIGPSTMRAIRQLPEEQKALIQQAVDTTNKDDLAEFIEQMLVKKAKKEEQLTLELDEAKAELEAKEEVAASNQKRINQLQEKAVLLKKLSPDEKTKQLCAEIAAQQTGIDEELRTNFYNALETLREHSGDHQTFINAQLQMLDDALQLLRAEFGGGRLEWEPQ